MTAKSKRTSLASLVAQPHAFVARLILADLIAKRGEGPLERKRVVYSPRKR